MDAIKFVCKIPACETTKPVFNNSGAWWISVNP
jgi:hypothetical protein